MKALRLILGIVWILTASSPTAMGKDLTMNFHSGKQKNSIEELLWKNANDLNAKLPTMVSSDIRLDSAVGVGRVFRYNYTLLNHSSSDVSAKDIDNAFGGKMIVNKVCTSKEVQVFVRNGVTMSYAYYGNDGKQITIISVAPSQCR